MKPFTVMNTVSFLLVIMKITVTANSNIYEGHGATQSVKNQNSMLYSRTGAAKVSEIPKSSCKKHPQGCFKSSECCKRYECRNNVTALKKMCMFKAEVQKSNCRPGAQKVVGGFCGKVLVNLLIKHCIRMKNAYPSLFANNRSKRSINHLFNIPLQIFAEKSLAHDGELTESINNPRMPFPLIRAKKAIKNSKLSDAQMRSIECDCCYNRCTPTTMAKYC